MVDGLCYLSRNDSINGIITEYEIYYSVDGETYTKAATGTWSGAQGTWYEVEFDTVRARSSEYNCITVKITRSW